MILGLPHGLKDVNQFQTVTLFLSKKKILSMDPIIREEKLCFLRQMSLRSIPSALMNSLDSRNS